MSDSRQTRYVFEMASLILSVGAGLLSYLLRQDLQLSLMLGAIVAVGLLVVRVAAELVQVQSLAQRSSEQLDAIHSSLVGRDHYLATVEHLNKSGSARLPDSVVRLHAALAEVPPALFGVTADMLADPVLNLERRHIIVPGESSSLGSHLVRTFQSDVFTTALHPMDFWKTPYGRNYDAAIRARLRLLRAQGTGVRFRRVFIVRDTFAHEFTEGFHRELVQAQANAGIEIRMTYESRLPADLLIDFGIWDGQLEVELEPDRQRRIIRRHYRYSAEAIVAAEQRAERIWDRSTEFDDWLREARIARGA